MLHSAAAWTSSLESHQMALGERASLTVMGLVMLGTMGCVLMTSSWKHEQKMLADPELAAQAKKGRNNFDDRLADLYRTQK